MASSADKKRKKKHTSGPASKESANKTPAVRPSTSDTRKRTPETHQQALVLSHQLRQLSNQKRLRECLSLYNSSENDAIRDAHHGSIVIDCCARCGDLDEAERVVAAMLGSTGTCINKDEYIWNIYDHIPYKKMPIQAWTALLKGYVHGGMMGKADSLFSALCGSKAERGKEGNSKKRKRVEIKQQDRANVRTLNTLLRGCLWSAATIEPNQKRTKSQQLVGGVVTAERAWEQFSSMNSDSTCVDSSSYEYFITLLCQSLQCEKAEQQLMQMKEQFKLSNDLNSADPTLIESLVVCLIVLSRAYALLGKTDDTKRCAKEALNVIRHIESPNSVSETGPAKKKSQIATGGKQAWKSHMNNDGSGRREQSNTLFRSHRISELKSEATSFTEYFKNEKTLAKMMVSKLLYFSGGGTTGLNAIADDNSMASKAASTNSEHTMLQWYTSLWFSFGLKHAAEMLKLSGLDKPSCSALSKDVCNLLHNELLGKEHRVITPNGYIDFNTVFSASADSASTRLHIELGSGSGDWAVIQAESNPSANYVTVELRADRVAQTFAKMVLHNPTNNRSQNKSSVLDNLCCVGSECGSFLRERIRPKTVRTIFVNHPEPPTQTSTSDDEQAHMLNSKTILAAAKCIESDGCGRIIIVTDNLIYAKLVSHTAAKVLDQAKLICVKPNEVSDLRKVETVSDPHKSGSFVHIYEGKPSTSIGHFTKSSNGTSYFDRLWRTGAGKYAEMKKRYIIALRTIGDQFYIDTSNKASQSLKKTATTTVAAKSKNSGKRSAEKQQRRNERRLLKKQQEQQQNQSQK